MQLGPQATSGSGIMGMFGKAKNAFANMSTAGKWGMGGVASWLLSQGMGGEEVKATTRDPNKLKPYLRMYYKNVNPHASDDEVNEFVDTNVSEYEEPNLAYGGRVGLYAGGNGEGIESIDIDEEKLQVGAPEITYRGNRIPQEENVASTDLYGSESDADEHSMRLFGKPFKVLSPDELEEFWNEMERLENKFRSLNISEDENMRVASHEGNDAWLENRVQQLMDEGMDWAAAAAQAQREMNEGDVPEPFLADGGRIGFNSGGETAYEKWLIDNYDLLVTDLSFEDHAKYSKQFKSQKAHGGRIGLKDGFMERYKEDRPPPLAEPRIIKDPELWHKDKEAWFKKYGIPPLKEPHRIEYDDEGKRIIPDYRKLVTPVKRAGGGMGMPTGIMRSNPAGVAERDYRDNGGFVPVGIKERADDVPAMLSKNEFVMTADAVRGAGGGNMDKGAQLMYNNMKNLEKRVV